MLGERGVDVLQGFGMGGYTHSQSISRSKMLEKKQLLHIVNYQSFLRPTLLVISSSISTTRRQVSKYLTCIASVMTKNVLHYETLRRPLLRCISTVRKSTP